VHHDLNPLNIPCLLHVQFQPKDHLQSVLFVQVKANYFYFLVADKKKTFYYLVLQSQTCLARERERLLRREIGKKKAKVAKKTNINMV